MEYTTLAAVDLGSNSFHLAVGRVVDDQIYPLDSLKETVRLGGGLTADKKLEPAIQEKALAALKRFRERLAGMPPRVRARGRHQHAARCEERQGIPARAPRSALGFPIEIISGREEARLIYSGVVHSLPLSGHNRLVVDIGGGSTEFIIGHKLRPDHDGEPLHGLRELHAALLPRRQASTRRSLKAAELAAREQVQAIASRFEKTGWKEAVGSSGTARSLAEVIRENGHSEGGITARGLEFLREELLKAGDIKQALAAGSARGARAGVRRRRGHHVGGVRGARPGRDDRGRRGAAPGRALGPARAACTTATSAR